MNSLVSIVIPTYNRSQVIERAIQSALNQTYGPVEIIIVDDGSTDNTGELVKKYPQVNYYFQENKGAAHARNTGVSVAKGEFIAFLDSDDIWLPCKLAIQMETLQKLHSPIIGSRKKYIESASEIRNNQKIKGNFHFINFNEQQKRTWCVPSTIVVSKDYFQSFGGFNPELKIGEDWDLWLKMAYQLPIPRLKDVLTYNFVTKGSLSENRLEKYLYDLQIIKKWNPVVNNKISPEIYRKWCLTFTIKRIFKLMLHSGQQDADIFWAKVNKELLLSDLTLFIGEELLRQNWLYSIRI